MRKREHGAKDTDPLPLPSIPGGISPGGRGIFQAPRSFAAGRWHWTPATGPTRRQEARVGRRFAFAAVVIGCPAVYNPRPPAPICRPRFLPPVSYPLFPIPGAARLYQAGRAPPRGAAIPPDVRATGRRRGRTPRLDPPPASGQQQSTSARRPTAG